MKAIIIAAGSGKRISNDVKNIPKSMVTVNGKPIIEYQISTLKEAGIKEIIVITGPYSEKFNLTHVKYVKDQHFTEHDILGSLMEAKEFLKDEIVILYSDIIFEYKILKKILESKENPFSGEMEDILCDGRLILTVTHGSVSKYDGLMAELVNNFGADEYTEGLYEQVSKWVKETFEDKTIKSQSRLIDN